jgi:DNA-binding transcriptional regulator YiaG
LSWDVEFTDEFEDWWVGLSEGEQDDIDMSKPISELRKNMSPERRKRIAAKTAQLKQEMALQELRQALDLTQQELAEKLRVNQAAVSKFENQSDIYIGTPLVSGKHLKI